MIRMRLGGSGRLVFSHENPKKVNRNAPPTDKRWEKENNFISLLARKVKTTEKILLNKIVKSGLIAGPNFEWGCA